MTSETHGMSGAERAAHEADRERAHHDIDRTHADFARADGARAHRLGRARRVPSGWHPTHTHSWYAGFDEAE